MNGQVAIKSHETWIAVCPASELVTDCGICVLLEEDGRQHQVAIFKLGEEALFALDNYDPIGKAGVLSRGITGSIGERKGVASPLYKQHFCLATGQCLEDAAVCLRTWPVRVRDDKVELQLP